MAEKLIYHAGLHGLLKSIQKPCHVKKFKGQTLGVDAYGWLHRGTVACAVDLVLDRPTTKYVITTKTLREDMTDFSAGMSISSSIVSACSSTSG
jgi:hypothetical protein